MMLINGNGMISRPKYKVAKMSSDSLRNLIISGLVNYRTRVNRDPNQLSFFGLFVQKVVEGHGSFGRESVDKYLAIVKEVDTEDLFTMVIEDVVFCKGTNTHLFHFGDLHHLCVLQAICDKLMISDKQIEKRVVNQRIDGQVYQVNSMMPPLDNELAPAMISLIKEKIIPDLKKVSAYDFHNKL